MTFDWYEWLNILVRWAHVFAGILWIGPVGVAVELEPSIEGLVSPEDLPEESEMGKLKVGSSVYVVVHSLDEKERRIRVGFVLDSTGEG